MNDIKVMFAHDHVFYYNKDNHYSIVDYSQLLWKRYLKVFSEIIVVGRAKEITKENEAYRMNNSSLEGVSFVHVPAVNSIKAQLFYKSSIIKMLERTILEKGIGLLIARLPSLIGLLAIQAAENIGIAWSVEMIGCPLDSFWYHGSIRGKIFAPFIFLKTREVVKRSKNTIYVTNSFLQKRYPCNGYIEGCSDVEVPVFDLSVIEKRMNKLKDMGDVLNIGLIGSMHTDYKGIKIAFKALSLVKKSNRHFKLEIVGGGANSKWKKMAKKYNLEKEVTFLGVLPSGKEIFDWLDTIDLYIQPSFQEGMPRSVLEAMSRGCPVLGSNAGGIPEIIEMECIHKKGNYKKLFKQIIMAFNSHKWLKKQAERNIEFSRRYNKEALDEKREKFWINLLSRIS